MRVTSVTDEPNNLADSLEGQVATDSAADDLGTPADEAGVVQEPAAKEQEREPAAEEEAIAGGEQQATAQEAVEDQGEEATAGEEAAVEESAEEEAAGEEEIEEEAVEDETEATLTPEEIAAALKQGEADDDIQMDWYILKVQSNRERSIAEALQRKIAIAGLNKYFGQVIVPTEKVTEFKGGKKKVVERKLYPGYIVVQMHINDDTWFAVRETSGVGDFTGAGGKPSPMLAHEVSRIVQTEVEETDEAPKLDIKFAAGEKVKVKEGNFESFEGEVSSIDEASGRVTVMINIFGRSTPVELEYWQIEAM
jgi:transcription termination/antitermination protein NusG